MADDVKPSDIDNEELRAFVASTLRAIALGIVDAQAVTNQERTTGYTGYDMPSKVAFDVGVAAKRTGGSKAGFKVEVFAVGAHLGGDISTERHSSSRIMFEVPWGYHQVGPIKLPYSDRGII